MRLDSSPTNAVSVLLVSPSDEDFVTLRSILSQSRCHLFHVKSCREARDFLQRNRVGTVLCEEQLRDGSWKDIRDQLASGLEPAPILVTSSAADYRLWELVLGLGGYDVLMKPFDEEQVRWLVESACRLWDEKRGRATVSSTPGPW